MISIYIKYIDEMSNLFRRTNWSISIKLKTSHHWVNGIHLFIQRAIISKEEIVCSLTKRDGLTIDLQKKVCLLIGTFSGEHYGL